MPCATYFVTGIDEDTLFLNGILGFALRDLKYLCRRRVVRVNRMGCLYNSF